MFMNECWTFSNRYVAKSSVCKTVETNQLGTSPFRPIKTNIVLRVTRPT